jgi:hypothetical protein
MFPDEIQKDLKKFGEQEEEVPQGAKSLKRVGGENRSDSQLQRPVFKLCQKPTKERTPLERRKIYSYIKGQVNFFKDLEREKLEMLAP